MNRADRLHAAAEWLGTMIDGLYLAIEPIAVRTAEVLAPVVDDGRMGVVGPDRLAAIRAVCEEVLEEQPSWLGAGLIFSVDRIAPGTRLIEWWSRQNGGTIRPVFFEHKPQAFNYYEFERLPWFSIARETGGPGFAGPYIDWTGTDDYIMTFTLPILIEEAFYGVVGCDITIGEFEQAIMPELRGVPGDTALLNAESRVVVGNSSRFVVGDVVRETPSGAEIAPISARAPGLYLLSVARGDAR